MSESSRPIQKPLGDLSLRAAARLAVAVVGVTAAIAWGSTNLGPATGAAAPASAPISAPMSALSVRNLAVRDHAPASAPRVQDTDDGAGSGESICHAPTSGGAAFRPL